MPPADLLDRPRVLAIQTDPPGLWPGESQALSALTFEVEAPLRWRACPTAWRPDPDGVMCPGGELVLADGNPIAVALPDVDALWLRVDALDSPEVLPAVRLVERVDGPPPSNPAFVALRAVGASLDEPVEPGAEVTLRAEFGDDVDLSAVVVTWYVTAGELRPRRTVGDEATTLAAPSEPGTVEIVGVARTLGGGVAWTRADLVVAP